MREIITILILLVVWVFTTTPTSLFSQVHRSQVKGVNSSHLRDQYSALQYMSEGSSLGVIEIRKLVFKHFFLPRLCEEF